MIDDISLRAALEQFNADVGLTRKIMSIKKMIKTIELKNKLTALDGEETKYEKYITVIYDNGNSEVFYPTDYGK